MTAPAFLAEQLPALVAALAAALAPVAAPDARAGDPQRITGPLDPALPPGGVRLAALLDGGPDGNLDGHLVLVLPRAAAARPDVPAPDRPAPDLPGPDLLAPDLLEEVGAALTSLVGTAVRLAEVAAPPATGSWTLVPLVGPGETVVGAVALQLNPLPAADRNAEQPAAAPFAPLPGVATPPVPSRHRLDLLAEVEMSVTAELGRTRLPLRQLLVLTPGAVIELDRAAGSPVDVLVNGTLIARGEVVVIDEEYGIRITEVVADTPQSGA